MLRSIALSLTTLALAFTCRPPDAVSGQPTTGTDASTGVWPCVLEDADFDSILDDNSDLLAAWIATRPNGSAWPAFDSDAECAICDDLYTVLIEPIVDDKNIDEDDEGDNDKDDDTECVVAGSLFPTANGCGYCEFSCDVSDYNSSATVWFEDCDAIDATNCQTLCAAVEPVCTAASNGGTFTCGGVTAPDGSDPDPDDDDDQSSNDSNQSNDNDNNNNDPDDLEDDLDDAGDAIDDAADAAGDDIDDKADDLDANEVNGVNPNANVGIVTQQDVVNAAQNDNDGD